MACKHRRSWILAGGSVEWCNECGAYRPMDKATSFRPAGSWRLPGMSWDDVKARDEAWLKRNAAILRKAQNDTHNEQAG